MASGSFPRRSVEKIFKDYCGRRAGLIYVLTEHFEEVYQQCDPDIEDYLCLYGNPNKTWKVTKPEEEVPPNLPHPVLGINFSKEKENRRAWRCQVAVHSDSWLLSVAFFLGVRLNSKERKTLFNMINNHSTVFEAVTNWKPSKDKPTVDSGSGSKYRRMNKRSGDVRVKNNPKFAGEGNKEDEDKQNICRRCGGNGKSGDEFWIFCDICERWFHGNCVNITPAMAERIDLYKCPLCSKK